MSWEVKLVLCLLSLQFKRRYRKGKFTVYRKPPNPQDLVETSAYLNRIEIRRERNLSKPREEDLSFDNVVRAYEETWESD